VVILALAFHLSVIYRSLQREDLQPSLPWTVLWFTLQAMIPGLHLLYMRRVVPRHQLQGHKAKPQGWGSTQIHADYPVGKPVCEQPLPAGQSEEQLEGAGNGSLALTQQHSKQQQVHDHRQTLNRSQGFPAARGKRVQSLHAAQQLLQRVQAGRTYQSRLAQSQVRDPWVMPRLSMLAWTVLHHDPGAVPCTFPTDHL
jgi:hypothetical protein